MQYNQQMFVWKIVLQKFNIKKLKIEQYYNNISNILHLPFDMLCNSIESMMARYKMYQQSTITLKLTMVQNCASSMTKQWLCYVFLYFLI